MYQKHPIYSCKLDKQNDELIIGGIEPIVHTYNLITGNKQKIQLPKGIKNSKSFQISPCGKYLAVLGLFGEVHLLHSMTKELLCTMKQECQSTAIHFSPDSKKLFSHSDDNEVTIFDLRTQRIEHRFVDEGCCNGTSITTNDRLIATGSRQGYVNVYNYNDVFAKKYPKPEKTVSNLTTEITDLKFNLTNEMLAICSSDTHNAVRFLHFPSATVISNFPIQNDKIGRPTICAFSPSSGFFAMGTADGTVPLYRLRHYNNY